MAYESVKNQIDAYIKANGVNLITGPVLNAVLTTMLDELGEGYAFQGILNTTDTPSPAADIPQAWLASAGTYLGGSITVDEGELALIIHTADGWSKETIYRGVQLSHDAILDALGYTPADEDDLAEKQDTISDLSAIRSGAALGSTSVQPVDIKDMVKAEPIGSIIPPVNPSQFATKEELSQLGQQVTPLLDVVETFRTENIFNEDAEITAYPLKILSSNAYDTSNFHFIFPIEINGQQGDIFTMKRFADAPDNILEYFLAAGNTLPAVGGSAVVQGGGNFTYQRSNVTLPSSCQYLFIVVRTTAVYPFPGESAARVMLEKTVIKKAQSASDYPTEYIPYEYQKVVIGSDNIDVNAEDIGAVAIKQGVAEMGKFLGVGADGKVTPIALPDPSATIEDAVVRKETKTLNLSANVLTEASVSLGTGWSGTLAAGISHASGSTDPLSFSINTESGEKYLVSFDLSAAAEKSVLVSIGDSPKVDVYNGQTHIDVGIIADGGQLNITPSVSSLAVTLTNIKLRKVVPESDAVDVVTLTQQNVEAGSMQNNISGFWNVAVGPLSGGPLAAVQNASRNVAIGYASLLRLKAGTRNIAIGTYSMPWVVEGDRNIAIGADTIYDAPELAAKASDCIAIGKASMKAGTDLQYNIAIGTSAMAYCNTNAKNTIAIGYMAGNYAANNNIHIGVRAGYYTKGQGNVSLGYGAMSDLYNTGSNNVCIGFQSGTQDPSSSSGNIVAIRNSIAIGANAKATKSNQCVIGASSVTEFVLGGKKLVFNQDGTITWTAQ